VVVAVAGRSAASGNVCPRWWSDPEPAVGGPARTIRRARVMGHLRWARVSADRFGTPSSKHASPPAIGTLASAGTWWTGVGGSVRCSQPSGSEGRVPGGIRPPRGPRAVEGWAAMLEVIDHAQCLGHDLVAKIGLEDLTLHDLLELLSVLPKPGEVRLDDDVKHESIASNPAGFRRIGRWTFDVPTEV
jgi:hypothetical protein